MCDDAALVEGVDLADAVTRFARTHRIVERKQPRLELGQRVVALGARETA